MPPTPPGTGPLRERFGPYIVQEKIGAGGMATVYRARHINSQHDVALKVLAIHLAGQEDLRRRFEREARTLIQFNHPHILPVFDFGEDGGAPYIALKLLSGRSLRDLLRTAPLAIPRIGQFTRQIASALDYAHARGIVHRDIKPANILLDEGDRPYLSDFGVAYLTESGPRGRLTRAGMFVGTAAYASPEQCRGEPVSRPSDIYALAVLVFQMATGRLPFEAQSPLAVIKLHLHEPPPNPLAFNDRLPIELYHVLVKALAKLPEHRFPSAMAFSEAVDAALGLHVVPEAEMNDASSEDLWLYGDLTPVSPDDDPIAPHTPSRASGPAVSTGALPLPFGVSGSFDPGKSYADQGDPFEGLGMADVAAGFANAEFDDHFDLHFEDDAGGFVDAFDDVPEEAGPRRVESAETARAMDDDFAGDDYPSAARVLQAALDAAPRPASWRSAPLRPPDAAAPPRSGRRKRLAHRTIAYSVIVIALAVIAAGTWFIYRETRDPTVALDATHRSPAFGITFDYPAGWVITLGELAILSAQPTATLHLSDQMILPGTDTGASTLVIAFQRIDPAAIYSVPGSCTGKITDGPAATFECMAARRYAAPRYTPFDTPHRTGGARLPGTVPPARASLPVILLPTGEPTWIALAIVHWAGFEDAQAMLDRVARTVR